MLKKISRNMIVGINSYRIGEVERLMNLTRREQQEVLSEMIKRRIRIFRGKKVILDRELAELYGISTKVLNQTVSRNADRFTMTFMFKLNWNEVEEYEKHNTQIRRGENIKYLPSAFTPYGIIAIIGTMRAKRITEVSLKIVEMIDRSS